MAHDFRERALEGHEIPSLCLIFMIIAILILDNYAVFKYCCKPEIIHTGGVITYIIR
jgi:hypothetical protein